MKYVGIAVLLLLLAGCGGDPQPRFSPSPTVSTPTTTAPAVETPQEFLRRWVRAIDVMERAGDVRAWQRMNEVSCKSCGVLESVVKAQHRRGWKILTAGSRVLAVSGRGVSWRLDLHGAPTRIVDGNGTLRRRLPGGDYTLKVHLHRLGVGWRVASYYELGGGS